MNQQMCQLKHGDRELCWHPLVFGHKMNHFGIMFFTQKITISSWYILGIEGGVVCLMELEAYFLYLGKIQSAVCLYLGDILHPI